MIACGRCPPPWGGGVVLSHPGAGAWWARSRTHPVPHARPFPCAPRVGESAREAPAPSGGKNAQALTRCGACTCKKSASGMRFPLALRAAVVVASSHRFDGTRHPPPLTAGTRGPTRTERRTQDAGRRTAPEVTIRADNRALPVGDGGSAPANRRPRRFGPQRERGVNPAGMARGTDTYHALALGRDRGTMPPERGSVSQPRARVRFPNGGPPECQRRG
jgi:hypothetical protein